MRKYKDNITLSYKNTISFLNNLTSHFIEKRKIITLSSIILTLSLLNITLTSALSYEAKTGVSFTINPSLSLSISSSDLVIDDLTPGTTADSNDITISIVTNAAYGYTLSATVDNNNLVRSDNVDSVFSSISTDASLFNLDNSEDNNIWGYSYKNNLAPTPTWSNYSGLSTDNNKVLFSTDHNTNNTIDFKIAAKASNTQPSGIYTNTINFIAVTKPIPKTIEDIAYMQTFGELNPTDLENVKSSMVLNQDYILKDSRDEKEYYVTRLEDGNVWMTQNLDLDIDSQRIYTDEDTDIPSNWSPNISTYSSNDWSWSNQFPQSYDPGQRYWSGNLNTNYDGTIGTMTDWSGNQHYHIGNYYNWTATIATNNSSSYTDQSQYVNQSICPKGWRLPVYDGERSFKQLIEIQKLSSGINGNIQKAPTYFVYGGSWSGSSGDVGSYGFYWSGTPSGVSRAVLLRFFVWGELSPQTSTNGGAGLSIRCLAR